MKNNRVKILLFFSTLIMTVLPLIAAFYFLDHTLQTSLNLGFNQQVVHALETASHNLKRLKSADPENESQYREQFEAVENLRLVYSKPELVRNNILDALKIYFGLGVAVAVFLSIAIAGLLSRRISHSYQVTFDELMKQKDKVRYLEEISSWQELAKMLAHEIKNPLTPIELLVTSLTKSYLKKSDAEFREQLVQTETMVSEELGHLKSIVNKFSEFSKLPRIQMMDEDLVSVVQQNIKTLSGMFDNAEFELSRQENVSHLPVQLDTTLFRQVLTNIVRNGIEANHNRKLHFWIHLSAEEDASQMTISNDGQPVSQDLVGRLFDPYVSGKNGKDNMGLGLAIVKKIIIEHGGEITYVEESGRPKFIISLRRDALRRAT